MKYTYPASYLTKSGTLKKSHLKKAAEFRRTNDAINRVQSSARKALARSSKKSGENPRYAKKKCFTRPKKVGKDGKDTYTTCNSNF